MKTLAKQNQRRVLLTLTSICLLLLPPWLARAATLTPTGALNTVRSQATSTLLQNGKVLIAGGYSTTELNTAELYDPATGVWTPTGPMDGKRYSHCATLLPNGKVLVTGGYNGSSENDTAELYDPASGTWSDAGTMSIGRQVHTATLLDNGKVLIAGGDKAGLSVANADLYDPVGNSWTQLQDMPSARYYHTATLLPNGKVLIAGGYNGTELNTALLFDPADNSWAGTGNQPSARYAHTAILLATGKVMVVGGSLGGPVNTCDLYNPADGTWAGTAAMGLPRYNCTATLLPNGTVLVAGGYTGNFTNSTEIYDPLSPGWTPGPTLAANRSLQNAIILPGGRVLVVGGYNPADGRLSSCEIYDTSPGSWAGADSMDTPRGQSSALLLPNGKVLAVGGSDGVNSLTSAELYDATNNSWTGTGGLGIARYGMSTTLLPDGKVLILGGYHTDTSSYVNSADLYDPLTENRTATAPMDEARGAFTATLMNNGKVLVVGGLSNSGILATAEAYNPTAGTWAPAGVRPSASVSHSATLLPNGKVLVVGGYDGSQSTSLCHLYNPLTNQWNDAGSLTTPRHQHFATLLPSGKVLVTGGYNTNAGGFVAAAEIYDPFADAWTSAGGLSSERYGHTATLLPDGRVLVAGGTGGAGAGLSCDLYDPASNSWKAAGPLAVARAYHTAVALSNGKVLVIGGFTTGNAALAATELFDPGLGFDNAWRPVISTLPSSLELGNALALTGTGFRGLSSASSSDAVDSATNYPVVQISSLENGQVRFLPPPAATPWSSTAFTSIGLNNFPPGHALVRVFANGIPSIAAFTVVTAPPPVPEIAVEQPENTDLTDDLSSIDFGTKGLNSASEPKTFKIRNIGTDSLNLTSAVTIVGGNNTDFAITDGGQPTTITPGGFVTVTVVFTPLAVGARASTLRITSNDANEGFFDIAITGTGQTAQRGTLAFSKALNLVSEAVPGPSIAVVRTGGTDGAVSVTVTSSPGSATLADYDVVNIGIVFEDGESLFLVPVSILSDNQNEPNEDFTLTLSGATNGAALGTPNPTTIRIVDVNDPAKPSVTITAPAASANFNEGSPVSVSGTAKDNKGVRDVVVTLNNGVPQNAVVVLDANGKSATYSLALTPVPGPNTISVVSIDTNDNQSAAVTRIFNYIVVRPLTVNLTGPANSGTLPAPFPGTDNTKRVGFTYSLTATPKSPFVFDGWSANNLAGTGLNAAALELPTITFIHQEGLILTASFILNPFNANVMGTYNGLVTPGGGVTSNETVGMLQNAKVMGNGTFTSTMKIDGLSKQVNGTFDNAGVARFGATRATTFALLRPGKPNLDVALQLDMAAVTRTITGTVTQTIRRVVTSTSNVNADRAHYSATSKVPSALAGTVTKPYTLIFPAKPDTAQPTGIAAQDYPRGDGYATMTVNVNGTVSINGKLADHTPIVASAPLSKDNQWPIFAQLYSTKGCFAGMATLTDANASTEDVTGTDLMWVRPYQPVQWYPFGWTDGVLVDLNGARYAVPTGAQSVFPDLDQVTPNATLRFFDGLLTATITKDITISATNIVTNFPAATSPTLTITKASGLIGGTFTHSDGTKPAYQGVIVQKGSQSGAHGYFMSSKPKVLTYLGESGRVEVEEKQ